METQTGDSSVDANPLKLLALKAGDFLRYSQGLENGGHSESNLLSMGAAALPSFVLRTAQMLGFGVAEIAAENCLEFKGGRGKGAGN